MLYLEDRNTLAYIIGVALGDGNLSNPNGRAVRLRITCDLKYPNLIETIKDKIGIIAPKNKIGTVKKKGSNSLDIYCYSNDWPKVLEWKVGAKHSQDVRVPLWVKSNRDYKKACLRGLFQTDGSIYLDRKYKMVNYVSCIDSLAKDTLNMLKSLGYKPTVGIVETTRYKTKYTIRISKNVDQFLKDIDLVKN